MICELLIDLSALVDLLTLCDPCALSLSVSQTQEEMAQQIAAMIISDVTSATGGEAPENPAALLLPVGALASRGGADGGGGGVPESTLLGTMAFGSDGAL